MVNKAINMNSHLNSMVCKFNRYHRNSIKYNLYKERNIFTYEFNHNEAENKFYTDMVHKIDRQWVKQLHQLFYYQKVDSEQISRWMIRMMRDKTSFWFDEISFEQIRSDFNEVKQSYSGDFYLVKFKTCI